VSDINTNPRAQQLLEALHSAKLARMCLTNCIRNRHDLAGVKVPDNVPTLYDRVLVVESNLDELIKTLEKELGVPK
jgi:hypothetical protein